jgi:hypothetical protein
MASGRGRTRRRRPDEIGWKTNGFDQVEQPRFPPGVAAGLLEGGVEQVEGMGQRAMTEVGPRGLDEVGPVAVEEDGPVVEAGVQRQQKDGRLRIAEERLGQQLPVNAALGSGEPVHRL